MTKVRIIPESELVLTKEKKVYHLNLAPEQIGDTIILVGDPQRVSMVSALFDSLLYKEHQREFITHTGLYKGKKITVLSTGIGPDNIDIVLNELDALANINLQERTELFPQKSLNLIRIGTSGSLHPDIPVDSFVISRHAIGLDNLLHFYKGNELFTKHPLCVAFTHHIKNSLPAINPYATTCSETLFRKIFSSETTEGITLTAPGFFGPQGRHVRLQPQSLALQEMLATFQYEQLKATNFEMETSALYGLSHLMGHQAVTICLIVANRFHKTFSKNYHNRMNTLIRYVLDRI